MPFAKEANTHTVSTLNKLMLFTSKLDSTTIVSFQGMNGVHKITLRITIANYSYTKLFREES